jgi:hypothetical protein
MPTKTAAACVVRTEAGLLSNAHRVYNGRLATKPEEIRVHRMGRLVQIHRSPRTLRSALKTHLSRCRPQRRWATCTQQGRCQVNMASVLESYSGYAVMYSLLGGPRR